MILRIIDELKAEGRIVLLATHDLASASCACDCLCCVNQRMISYGPTAQTYTPEVMAQTYGGLPVIMLNRADVTQPEVHAHDEHTHAHEGHTHTHDGHTH